GAVRIPRSRSMSRSGHGAASRSVTLKGPSRPRLRSLVPGALPTTSTAHTCSSSASARHWRSEACCRGDGGIQRDGGRAAAMEPALCTRMRAMPFAARLLCLALLLPLAARAQALFGAGFQDFRPTSGKVVAVYVPGWQPPTLLDNIRHGNATHLLYAFMRACGPGQ